MVWRHSMTEATEAALVWMRYWSIFVKESRMRVQEDGLRSKETRRQTSWICEKKIYIIYSVKEERGTENEN